jgi:hypothetical protein
MLRWKTAVLWKLLGRIQKFQAKDGLDDYGLNKHKPPFQEKLKKLNSVV